jgi:hypothetical protein
VDWRHKLFEFAREFLQVQTDKFLLAYLLIWFYVHGSDPKIYMGILGALILLIQGRRFKQ